MDTEKEIVSLEEIDRQYQESAALLLDRIAKRDELKSLLKIATPFKIAALREIISRFDKSIDSIEQELELIDKMRIQRLELDKNLEELEAMTEKMKPEFLDYVAKHHPDRLAEMEALFSNEDSSKSH